MWNGGIKMEKELHKQAIKRNFIFWSKLAEKYIVITVGMMLCYGIFLSYIGGKDSLWKSEMWQIMYIYQIILIIVSAIITPASYGTTYIPLLMSFGSKRREAVWGLQWMNWLVLIEMEAILILFAYLSSIKLEQFIVIIFVALFGGIIGIALGQIIMVCGFRFGMKGLILATVVIVLLAVIGGNFILFYVNFGIRFDINLMERKDWIWKAIGLSGLAIALYIGSNVVLLRIIQKYEVRR